MMLELKSESRRAQKQGGETPFSPRSLQGRTETGRVSRFRQAKTELCPVVGRKVLCVSSREICISLADLPIWPRGICISSGEIHKWKREICISSEEIHKSPEDLRGSNRDLALSSFGS